MPSLSASSSSVFHRLTGKRPAAGAAPGAGQVQETTDDDARSDFLLSVAGDGEGGRPRLSQQHRRENSLLSLPNSVTDLGHNVRRSVSLRSHRRYPSTANTTTTASGGTVPRSPPSSTAPSEPLDHAPHLPRQNTTPQPPRSRGKLSLPARSLSTRFRSAETLPLDPAQLTESPPRPAENPPLLPISPPKTPPSVGMLAGPRRAPSDRPTLHKQTSFSRDPPTSHTPNINGAPLPPTSLPSAAGNPNAIHQMIHETAAKRMATIECIRKVHDGNIFYFNTLHYTPNSLHTNIPSLQNHKLGRRATAYLVLGYSLPALLDMNSGTPMEYLKALFSLLQEFETYQSLSGFDASSGSSLSRARVGQMFKSGMGLGSRSGMRTGRRSSAATDSIAIDTSKANLLGIPPSGPVDTGSPIDVPSPVGHEFQYLLTPHLPFEPDFSTTFATLCDTLIDTYGTLLSLISTPELCTPAVGDAFSKADKLVRKILVSNVMREFEENARQGAKAEVAGLGKLVLSPLI
ncbi:hypothetical protein KC327_g13848 [Hortaea werneckii]|nr:hypothetical protein KC350_g5728 [Hortaea werneckii]KAI6845353.1 hypothetical protein KC358_g3369 [Hortaea werneckii]KAI6940742.1 hypothetical protein KC341_g3325 [Hortaea werneckii]KAI6949160.1 hypothetical protein KC348_g1517 [Hortaea werneckii]KAI6981279.1 hypothetical protein KC321_g1306 [Hortaea werneckii]